MRSRFDIPDSLLHTVTPLKIRNFLLNFGFELSGKNKNIAEAYIAKSGEIVILPLKQESHEYLKLIFSLMEHLGQLMKLSTDDIFGLIANPNSDILRYKIKTEESKFGHIGADEIRSVTDGLYNVLYNSAKNIARFENRLKVLDSAKNYANQCKFGQTEYGSFILKVFCPSSDLGARSENSEPYCREVTRGVVRNFRLRV